MQDINLINVSARRGNSSYAHLNYLMTVGFEGCDDFLQRSMTSGGRFDDTCALIRLSTLYKGAYRKMIHRLSTSRPIAVSSSRVRTTRFPATGSERTRNSMSEHFPAILR